MRADRLNSALARVLAAAVLALGLSTTSMPAQGLFSPVLIINDNLVTRYELDQRVTFLGLLGASGDLRQLALNQLTVETLQLETAAAAGFAPTQAAIEAGQAEFASRANLSREQFVAALAQGGADPSTFRDFIAAGVAWRAYVQDRFRGPAEAFPPAQLDRATETAEVAVGRRVLLSEILLPASTPQSAAVSRSRAAEFSRITSEEAFAAAARQFSQANSRFEGGEVDWRLVDDLPPVLGETIRNLSVGRASRPVELGEQIGVYFLRDEEFTPETSPAFSSVDYQLLRLPGRAPSEAAAIAAEVGQCDEIERLAARYPESALSRQTTLLTALPASIAAIVSRLDTGETAAGIGPAGEPVVVSICQRTFGSGAAPDFNRLRVGLVNERLQILAAAHLNDIRARAIIIGPEG